MTAYVATANSTSTPTTLLVVPGSYEIRIAQVVFSFAVVAATDANTTAVAGYYSGGASGGSSVPIGPMRVGSPAATATATSGGSGSGTFYTMGTYLTGQYAPPIPLPGPPASIIDGTIDFATADTFSPPFDLILAPGSAFSASISATAGSGATPSYDFYVTVYFEELRLSWHY